MDCPHCKAAAHSHRTSTVSMGMHYETTYYYCPACEWETWEEVMNYATESPPGANRQPGGYPVDSDQAAPPLPGVQPRVDGIAETAHARATARPVVPSTVLQMRLLRR